MGMVVCPSVRPSDKLHTFIYDSWDSRISRDRKWMDRFPVAAASQSALALATGGLPIDAALTKDWKPPTCLMSGRLHLNLGAVKKKKKKKKILSQHQ